MPDARNQKSIDSGSATMYRTRPMKCSSRKMLPMKPHASEIALQLSSL